MRWRSPYARFATARVAAAASTHAPVDLSRSGSRCATDFVIAPMAALVIFLACVCGAPTALAESTEAKSSAVPITTRAVNKRVVTADQTPSTAPAPRRTFVPPMAPELRPARLASELHTGFAAPLENSGLCPGNNGCVLRSGGGVGASIELRRPSGFGWFTGYDIQFLDSDGVFELGVQQLLRVGTRYTAPTDIIFHPTFDIALGGHVYGDTFGVATFGGLFQVFSGAEIELSETYAMRLGFGLRLFSHTHFRTERDGVSRGGGGILSEMLFGEIGLGFM